MGIGKRRAGALVASTLAVAAVGGLAFAWPGHSANAGPAGHGARAATVKLTGQVPVTVCERGGLAAARARHGLPDQPELRVPAPRQGGARPADRAAGEDAPAPHARAALRALLAAAGAGRRPAHLARRPGLPDHARRRRPPGVSATATTAPVERACTSRSTTTCGPARRSGASRSSRTGSTRTRSDPTVPAAPRPADHLGPERRRPLLHRRRSSSSHGAERDAERRRLRRRRQRRRQPALRRRAHRRLLPGRPARRSTTSPATASTAPARRSASRCGPPPSARPAMTAFATDTGDQPITVDPTCVATGNSPTDAELVHDAAGRAPTTC